MKSRQIAIDASFTENYLILNRLPHQATPRGTIRRELERLEEPGRHHVVNHIPFDIDVAVPTLTTIWPRGIGLALPGK